MNIYRVIKQFLEDDNYVGAEFTFSILNAKHIKNMRFTNLPSDKNIWKVVLDKSILGNVTFWFLDGLKYRFGLVVEDMNFRFDNENEEINIEKFIVLGQDPIAGTKITIAEDFIRVNANINPTGASLSQEYKNCLSFNLSENRIITQADLNQLKAKQNCYVATLVYKDINHPKVEKLREYRDNKLSECFVGKLFIKVYYLISPKAVIVLKYFPNIQKMIKTKLDKFINNL